MSGIEDHSILDAPQPDPDSTLQFGPAPENVADIFLPDGDHVPSSRRLIVFIHGGFWRPAYDRIHARRLVRALASDGFAVASIEYRRTPGSPDAAIDDVLLALARLPSLLTLPVRKPALIGHSAGGQLALLAAIRCPNTVAGVVALAPVGDLQMAQTLDLGSGAVRAFLGGDAETRDDLNPAANGAPLLPVAVVQGLNDSIVPPSVARSLQASWGAGLRLILVPDTAHFDLIDPTSSTWPTVLAEARRVASAD
ncbi:MAG: alpha/beta fold hydrolase [Actinobacteria bacterium]|uniref:Unannotated protein n=1 Tax=freshwater metagenome TaxID=449393 RepID=A0A6J7CSF7_9ZZZZ|nr:alpha/beta fold hydrolase [Actinomycetota bacterium]